MVPEHSKALGSPSCWPNGVLVPQPGWAGELSKSWPCVWKWSVMTVDTAFSQHTGARVIPPIQLPHPLFLEEDVCQSCK